MARNYDINGLFEWAAGFIPQNLNIKTWLVDVFDVKGGPQVLESVQELVDFHPFKMKKGQTATIVDYPTGGVNTTFTLNTPPDQLVDASENTLVTLDNFRSFWDEQSSVQSSKDIVYQYAPNYLGGQPLFPYVTDEALRQERDGVWKAVLNKAAGDKWFRTRDDDSFTMYPDPDAGPDIKVFDNWTRPLPLGATFENGDYIENRFKREVEGATGISSEGSLVLDKFYLVDAGLVTRTRVADGLQTPLGVGSTFQNTSSFTFVFDVGTLVNTLPDIPNRTTPAGLPNNEPAGWTDSIPAGTDQLWKIFAAKSVRGQLKSEWVLEKVVETPELLRYSRKSTPNPNTLMTTGDSIGDLYGGTVPEYIGLTFDEILTLEGWNPNFIDGETDFIATRDDLGAPPWSQWAIEKIGDESGEYTDYVFKLFPVNVSPATLNSSKPVASDPSNEGFTDSPQLETDTLKNYVSKARKFFDGTLKTDWSELVPYTGADVYAHTILLPDDNDFKYDPNSVTPTVPVPEELRLIAILSRGLSDLWKESGNTISYKWEKTFDNGAAIDPATEIVSNNDTDNAYLKLQADMTPEELAAEYRDNQILVIKHPYITGKAYFRLTTTLSTSEGDIEFVQIISLLDITDGLDRKALEIGNDGQLAIYDTTNELFNPASFLLYSQFANLPGVSTFYWYFNNGAGYTAIDGTEPNFALTGTKDNVLTVSLESTPVALSGTASSSGTAVTGAGTLFSTELVVGNYLKANGELRRIESIANSTSLVVDAAFTVDLSGATIERVDVLFDRDTGAEDLQIALSTNPTDPTLADGENDLSDYLTIAKSSSAAIGSDGDDAAVAILTQEAYTTVLDQATGIPLAGELGTGGNVQTDIQVFSGDVRLDFNAGDFTVGKGADPTGITTEAIRTSPTNSLNANLWVDTGNWVANTRSGKIVLTITTSAAFGSKVIVKEFTLASTKDAPGAILLDLDISGGNTFNRGAGGLTDKVITARLYDVINNVQTELGPTNYYYRWSGAVSTGWVQGAGGSNGELSPAINRTSIFLDSTVTCEVSESVTGTPVLRQQTVRITDITDAKTYRLYSSQVSEPAKPIDATDPTATQGVWAASQAGAIWASDGFEKDTNDNPPMYAFNPPYQITGETGSQGPNGGFLLPMYKNFSEGSPGVLPAAGNTSTLAQMEAASWTYSPPAPVFGQYLWITQRPFSAFQPDQVTPVSFDGAGKPDTDPMAGSIWVPPAQAQGFDGINGDAYEFRYAKNTSAVTAPALTNTQRTPSGWSLTYPSRSTGEFVWEIKALIDGTDDTLVGTWGTPTLKTGETGAVGATGLAPEHQWSGTSLRFRNPNGTWGSYVGLKGDKGDDGADGADGVDASTSLQKSYMSANPLIPLSFGSTSARYRNFLFGEVVPLPSSGQFNYYELQFTVRKTRDKAYTIKAQLTNTSGTVIGPVDIIGANSIGRFSSAGNLNFVQCGVTKLNNSIAVGGVRLTVNGTNIATTEVYITTLHFKVYQLDSKFKEI
jgi:hypothetical protein